MKKRQQILIICCSLCVLSMFLPLFGMKKKTGCKRKRLHNDAGKAKKKRKLCIGDEKVERINRKQQDEQQKAKKQKCVICLEHLGFSGAVEKLQNCSHRYHSICINKWFEENNRCPLCRKAEFCFVCKEKFKKEDTVVVRDPSREDEPNHCGHRFHKSCFKEKNIKDRCPLCPLPPPLDGEMLLQLFLGEERFAPPATITSDRFVLMFYLQEGMDRMEYNRILVFDREGECFFSIELQEKDLLGYKLVEERFFVVEYDLESQDRAHYECDIFDLQEDKKHSKLLQKKAVMNWYIIRDRFVIAEYDHDYDYVRGEDGEMIVDSGSKVACDVFDLLEDKQFVISLKPLVDIESFDVLCNRFVVVLYDGDEKNKKTCDVFDLQEDKQYSRELYKENIIDYIFKKGKLVFSYEGGSTQEMKLS